MKSQQEFLEILDRMDSMIMRKATGNPTYFASQLAISPATLYRYLQIMRDRDAPIKYSTYHRSYIYCKAGSFRIGFNEKGTFFPTPDE